MQLPGAIFSNSYEHLVFADSIRGTRSVSEET